jgi:hypothetical protein
MRAGKLTAGQRAWAESLIARDETLFEEWFRTAPVVVAPGALTAPKKWDSDALHRKTISRARAEYRTHPALSAITTEDAYVADALRIVA